MPVPFRTAFHDPESKLSGCYRRNTDIADFFLMEAL